MEWWQWALIALVVVGVVYYMIPKITPRPTACSSCPGKQPSS